MGVVVHRAVLRDDARTYRRAMVVLSGNEVWNAFFLGRRSTRDGFLGVLAFLPPLALRAPPRIGPGPGWPGLILTHSQTKGCRSQQLTRDLVRRRQTAGA